jgi:hypothetical protein
MVFLERICRENALIDMQSPCAKTHVANVVKIWNRQAEYS